MNEQIFSPLPGSKNVKPEEKLGELEVEKEINNNSLERVNEWRLKELTAVADAMAKGDQDFRLESLEINPGFFDLGRGELVDIREEVIEVKRKLIDAMLVKYWDALGKGDEADINERKNEVLKRVEEYAEFLYQPKQYATPSEVSEAARERKAALAEFNERLKGSAKENSAETGQDEALAA